MGFFRLLLSISVIIGHMRLSADYMINGGYAVEIFFMISGFYMAMILTEKYGNTTIGIKTFAINRFMRLYPIYIVIFVMTLMWFMICKFMTHGGTPDRDILKLDDVLPWWQSAIIWLPNFSLIGIDLPSLFHWSPNTGFQFLKPLPADDVNGTIWVGYTVWVGQAWSVGSEIWFYLLSPLIVFGTVKRIVGFASASLMISILCYYKNLTTHFFWPSLLIFFIIGITIYKVSKKYDIYHFLPNSNLIKAGISFTPLIWLIGFPSAGYPLPKMFLYIVAAFSIPILFSITKSSKIDRFIGNLSYSTYLNHLLIGSILSVLIKRMPCLQGMSVMLNIISSIALAVVLEFLVEQPVEKFRANFSKMRLQSASQSS